MKIFRVSVEEFGCFFVRFGEFSMILREGLVLFFD